MSQSNDSTRALEGSSTLSRLVYRAKLRLYCTLMNSAERVMLWSAQRATSAWLKHLQDVGLYTPGQVLLVEARSEPSELLSKFSGPSA